MEDNNTLFETEGLLLESSDEREGSVSWRSPSNIALVKYWGKHGIQLPDNPSLSLTLSKAHTTTTVKYSARTVKYSARTDRSAPIEFSFLFEGREKADFASRIGRYLESVLPLFPFLSQLSLEVSSSNSFPHSSGIASSASAMSALALCLCSIEEQYFDTLDDQADFERKASFAARLGSGSACRSIFSQASLWGNIRLSTPGNSAFANNKDGTWGNDLYAIPMGEHIHEIFVDYRDTILIVDDGVKKVSSSSGHALMETHPYRDLRIKNANRNLEKLLYSLQKGDLEGFISVVEKEAMELHALMMTSYPPYILMAASTLEIIKRIVALRKEENIPVCFTLDAGPNVHMLYPESYSERMELFVAQNLLQYCENEQFLVDRVGIGPVEL